MEKRGNTTISPSIINYIDSNLREYTNDIELAYMIYVLLNKVLVYSPDYAFSKDSDKLPSTEEITLDNPYVNCHTWSVFFAQVLLHYGIYSEVFHEEYHSHVEIYADGLVIEADPTKVLIGSGIDYTSDLCNYKFGFKGISFNIKQELSTEESRSYLHSLKEKVLQVLDINSNQEKDLVEYLSLYNDTDDLEDRVLLGIGLLNNVYNSVPGASVEKRQILEQYFVTVFGLEFEGYDYSSMYTIEDNNRVPHRLIFFELPNETLMALEETNGFRSVSIEEINNMVNNHELFFKYDIEKEAFAKLSKRV